MDSGYFICDICSGEMYVSGCVVTATSFELPDGRYIFHAVLTNGQELIVIGRNGAASIFDMEMAIEGHEVRLYIDDIAEQYSCIGVQTASDKGIVVKGDLILSEDMTIFEAEVIGTEVSRKLWTKAVMLCGNATN